MKIDKYWWLRIKKFWITKIIHRTYRNLLFDIAHTDIVEGRKFYDYGELNQEILAEFDCGKKHYVILSKL